MSPLRLAEVGPDPCESLPDPAVLVVEKNAFTREGLGCLLEAAGFRVDWKTADPNQCVALCRRFADATLVLAGLPAGRSPVEVVRELQGSGLQPTMVVVAHGAEDDEILNLIAHGVNGIVDQDDDPAKLCEAIRATRAQADVWLSPGVAVALLPARMGGHPEPSLTARERELLWRLAHGQRSSGIADEMFISSGTVRNHLCNIYSKLGVHSRAEAVAWAWRTGLAQSRLGAGQIPEPAPGASQRDICHSQFVTEISCDKARKSRSVALSIR